MFKEGELTSPIFSFDESHGVSSSTLVDFSTRITWSLLNPKDGRAARSVSAAHLPVPRDNFECLPHQYSQESVAGIPAGAKKPKTFKPVLIYQRPEDPQTLLCTSEIKDADKNDSIETLLRENCLDLPEIKSEKPPLQQRVFTENATTNRPAKEWDLYSLFGKEVQKRAVMNSSAGMHRSNGTDFSSRTAAFDGTNSSLDRLSFALSDKRRSSFGVPMVNPGTGQICRSWISTLARHQQHGDVVGSATEIRRALLLNHPVITTHLATGDPLQKLQQHTELPNRCYPDHPNAGPRHPQEASSKIANRFILPFSPHQGSPAWSTLSPLALTEQLFLGRADTAQSSDGHGSFLQLLFSKDAPAFAEGTTSTGLGCCAACSSVCSATKDQRLPSPVKDRVFQTVGDKMVHAILVGGSTGDVDDRETRKHKCPFCDVTCTNNGQLKGHLRVHTGEKPFQCECGRAFARNEELTRHRRIHSGVRPHQCHTCGKRFGRKDHLNKHQKTHLRTSEKKVHLCQVGGCRQRYTRSDALARHQWGAHGIRARTTRYRLIPFTGVQSSQQEAEKN